MANSFYIMDASLTAVGKEIRKKSNKIFENQQDMKISVIGTPRNINEAFIL
jgi:hypothetical protein